jgi:hypothetical protein
VIALPCLLATMDLDVLNPAVPALAAGLQPSSAQLLWIIDIFGFMVAGSLLGGVLLERTRTRAGWTSAARPCRWPRCCW